MIFTGEMIRGGIVMRTITITCELPEDVYRALANEAAGDHRTVAEVVAERLSRGGNGRGTSGSKPDDDAERIAAFERHLGAWDSGDPRSADHPRIDSDLAGEYGGGDAQRA